MPGSGQGNIDSSCESRSIALVEVMQQGIHPLAKLPRSHDRIATTPGCHQVSTSLSDPTLTHRAGGRENRRRRFRQRVADEVSTAPSAPTEIGVARQPRLSPTTNGAPLPQAATMGRTTHHRGERPEKGIPAGLASTAHLPITLGAPSANHGQKARLREHAMPGTHGETGEVRLKGQWLQGRSEGVRTSPPKPQARFTHTRATTGKHHVQNAVTKRRSKWSCAHDAHTHWSCEHHNVRISIVT